MTTYASPAMQETLRKHRERQEKIRARECCEAANGALTKAMLAITEAAYQHGRISKWMSDEDRTEAKIAKSAFLEAAKIVRRLLAEYPIDEQTNTPNDEYEPSAGAPTGNATHAQGDGPEVV